MHFGADYEVYPVTGYLKADFTRLGYPCARAGTLTKYKIQTDHVNTYNYVILKNLVTQSTITFANVQTQTGSLSIPVAENDTIQMRVDSPQTSQQTSVFRESSYFGTTFELDANALCATNEAYFQSTGNPGIVNSAITGAPGKFGNGLKFDGTGGRNVFISNQRRFDTAVFTMEFWAQASQNTSATPPYVAGIICKTNTSKTNGNHIRIYQKNSDLLVDSLVGSTVTTLTATNAFSVLNTWVHVAVVCGAPQGIKIFINGTLSTSNSGVTTGLEFSPDPIVIGADSDGSTESLGSPVANPFNGLIDEFRFSNIRRYENNFTPSAVAFTPDEYTIALYHFDEAANASFVADSALYPQDAMMQYTSTTAIPTFQTSLQRFGAVSWKGVTSNAAWLGLTHHPFLQVSSFTVTMQIQPFSAFAITGCLFQKGGGTNEGDLTINLLNSNKVLQVVYRGTTGSVTLTTPNNLFALNRWYQVAVAVTPTTIKVYVNGTKETSNESLSTDFQNGWLNNTGNIRFGSTNASTNRANVYFDDLHIYTEEVTFGVPNIRQVSAILQLD
jgi:hypothetical protein